MLAGATGAGDKPLAGTRQELYISFYIEAGGISGARAMITLLAPIVHIHAEGESLGGIAAMPTANRGPCVAVAAAHSMPATASSSPVRFLLTAREDGLWVDLS